MEGETDKAVLCSLLMVVSQVGAACSNFLTGGDRHLYTVFFFFPSVCSHDPHPCCPTPTMGSKSSKKLAGLFKGLLFSPVTHILDATGNGDTRAVTIWIQLLSARRNWKGLHNDPDPPHR